MYIYICWHTALKVRFIILIYYHNHSYYCYCTETDLPYGLCTFTVRYEFVCVLCYPCTFNARYIVMITIVVLLLLYCAQIL